MTFDEFKTSVKENKEEIITLSVIGVFCVAPFAYAHWMYRDNVPVSSETLDTATETITTVLFKTGRTFTETIIKTPEL